VTLTPEPDHRPWLIGTARATDIACAPLGLPGGGSIPERTLQRALMRRSVSRKKTLPDPASLKGGTPTKIINIFLRRLWTGQFRSKPCSHVHLARSDIGPASDVCGECVALGDSWPALRMCLLCGYVGCCDKSKNKHAREHFRQTDHPLIRPLKERGMDWVWCYLDEALLDPI
jgi:hypothetical protein